MEGRIRINNPHNEYTPLSDYKVIVRNREGKEHRRIEPTDGRGRFDHQGIALLGWYIWDVIERVKTKD